MNGCPLSGIRLDISADAVVLVAEARLRVASTAVVNGGLTSARSIVNLHGDPSPAALLNAMTTVTEAKTLILFQAGVRCGDVPATGTSTDAVVIGATGRGGRHEYGGPATDLGWSVARAARVALELAVARWQAAHG